MKVTIVDNPVHIYIFWLDLCDAQTENSCEQTPPWFSEYWTQHYNYSTLQGAKNNKMERISREIARIDGYLRKRDKTRRLTTRPVGFRAARI